MRPLAEIIMIYFAEFFRINGIKAEVPLPTNSRGEVISDEQINLWLEQKWSLYYRPSSEEAPFIEMMDSFSGTSSWTTYELETFREANWERAEEGYWFWADIDYSRANLVRDSQLGRDDISKLLCLEEYVIFDKSTDWPNPLVQNYPMWKEENMWLRTLVNGRPVAAKKGNRITAEFNGIAYPRFCRRY